MKKITLILSIIFSANMLKAYAIQPHEIIWENYWSPEILNVLATYYTAHATDTKRLIVRNHVKEKKYKTILDIGFGAGLDFFLFINDCIAIDYYGVEFDQKIVDIGIQNGIKARKGSIEHIPFESNSMDICYTCDVIECCEYYDKSIYEMIRVAQKEVLIVFFIPPTMQPDIIEKPNAPDGKWHYANHYNKQKLERFILSHKKVKKIEWEDFRTLHIYLKDNECV